MNLPANLKQQFIDIVGAEHATDDQLEREYYSQDVFSSGTTTTLVVSPENSEALCQLVALANEHDLPMIARGGGMSYSGGYTPVSETSIMIDMAKMNRVLEINTEDMYVTVEAGISWKALHEALKNTGLRTPYWGTLSGINATVGGSVSQNSIFWGSGEYGSAADSVLSLGIVLSDGSMIKTGSAAKQDTLPFFRHYGPDITGLFTSDCGALGFKATVTLRLIPVFEARAYGSFAFDNHADMLHAMAEITRQNLAKECFGFDPYLQTQRMKRESIGRDASQLLGVVKNSGGVVQAMKDSLGLAVSGRRFMKDVSWSFSVIIEEHTAAAADNNLIKARAIAKQHNGKELANSIPKLVRSNPFGPVNNMVGPEGERWVPVHGLVPHSQAVKTMDALDQLFKSHQAVIDQYHIGVGYLLASVSTTCTVIEPVFFWPDQLEEIHKRSLEPAHLKNLKGFEGNEDARNAVKKIRQQVAKTMHDCGAVNLQIGKSYPYREVLDPTVYAILTTLKDKLDPKHLINPGVLGLD